MEKNTHLLELARYVVLNPVRAKLLKTPERYLWSSYPATLGLCARPAFLFTDWILSQFGDRRRNAVLRYKKFVEDGVSEQVWEKLKGQIFLGSEQFIERHQSKEALVQEIPKTQQRPLKISLSELLKKRDGILLAYRDHGHTLNSIAQHLGIHYTTVSKKLQKLEATKN